VVPGSGIGYGWRLLFDIAHLGFDSREGRRAQAPFHAVHARTNRLDVLLDSVRFLLAGQGVGGENQVMPRTLRASVGCYCYHALNRGNERSRVLNDADDCHPLRAGLVTRAQDWAWSSLPLWLNPPLMPWLDAGPVPRPAAWLDRVHSAQTEAELAAIRRSVARGCPYGSSAWVERTAEQLGPQSSLHDPGRPRGRVPQETEAGSLFS
jgi:hypothetical protein